MRSSPDTVTLKQVDQVFLDSLRIGDRLFHYPPKGNAEKSFKKSPSAEQTLYSVIEIPTEKDIILIGAFDKEETKRSYEPSELLSGDWWYNPDFK
jgi:hypothetical protein